MVERAFATRPQSSENGLGLSIEMVTKEIEDLRRLFALVLEPASIFEEWEGLVTSNRVSGKHVRDARLVAALKLLGLSRILKFNVADVACYTNIEVIHPQSV